MNLNDYFNKIFFINLDDSTQRLYNILNEFQQARITNYERMPGIRLTGLDNIPAENYNNLQSHQKINDFYKIGICGANMAHVKCIEEAKNRGYNKVLILEDDIGIHPDINNMFEKIVNQIDSIHWDMLFLGYANITTLQETIVISDNIIKNPGILACHAYAVNHTIYDTILADGIRYGAELDNYYKHCIIPNFNCICITPRLIWQNNGDSITLQGYRDTMNYTRDEL